MRSKQQRTFGSVLKTRREERGLSLRALAKAAELSPSTVSRFESDEMKPADDTVRRLAKVLGLAYKDLAVLATGNLPNFAPYLRAKFDLDDEAIRELEAHFAAVTRKHPPTGRKP